MRSCRQSCYSRGRGGGGGSGSSTDNYLSRVYIVEEERGGIVVGKGVLSDCDHVSNWISGRGSGNSPHKMVFSMGRGYGQGHFSPLVVTTSV